MVNDSGRWGESWIVLVKALEGFEVVCELCDIAVVNVSEIYGDKLLEPLVVYG